jgi:hypothetical protein
MGFPQVLIEQMDVPASDIEGGWAVTDALQAENVATVGQAPS